MAYARDCLVGQQLGGELPAMPVVSGGLGGPHIVIFHNGRAAAGGRPAPPPPPVKLKDAADALLYVGSRDSLTQVPMPRAELEGTQYGREIQCRLKIEGLPSNPELGDEKTELPQFSRPQPDSSAGPLPLPPPPKNMNAPLPPRPLSQ